MSLFLRALHEAGHAIVAKAVGHDVYLVHIGDDGDYCDSGYLSACPDGTSDGSRRRALVALGGYFATAMYGQSQGYDVSDWSLAEQDWANFESHREGSTFRHARKKVTSILAERKEALLALARRVELERDVRLDPHPSEYAEAVEL